MEQQERIAHAINSSQSGEASIRSPKERDRSRHHLAHRGGLRLSTGTRPYGDCWSTLCCLAVWSIWVESSTALGGFRVLKKTSEAPYTTKVNYRDRTSRGTTRAVHAGWYPYNFLFRIYHYSSSVSENTQQPHTGTRNRRSSALHSAHDSTTRTTFCKIGRPSPLDSLPHFAHGNGWRWLHHGCTTSAIRLLAAFALAAFGVAALATALAIAAAFAR